MAYIDIAKLQAWSIKTKHIFYNWNATGAEELLAGQRESFANFKWAQLEQYW